MAKMRETKPRQRRATDHRAIVLEVVATIPTTATRDAVQAEVARENRQSDFNKDAISAMVSTLRKEGLIGVRDDGTLFVTELGFTWLRTAAFDLPLPGPYTKPGRRKRGDRG